MDEKQKITMTRDTFIDGKLVKENESVTVPISTARYLLGKGKAIPADNQKKSAKKGAA